MMPRNVGSGSVGTQRAGAVLGKFTSWDTYFSTIRFAAEITVDQVTGAVTYFFGKGQKFRFFSYKQGEQVPGFPSPTLATPADTNLTKASQTEGGENVFIHGVSLMLNPQSDSFFAKMLFELISASLALNGNKDSFKFGRPDMIPCGGGLTGIGDSYVQTPPTTDTYQSRSGNLTNGVPLWSNFYPLPEPMIWQHTGEDSTLTMAFELERDFSFTVLPRAADVALGIPAFAPPTEEGDLGTHITLTCRLWSEQESVRSQNR
jgi:hypothetical protein